MEPLRGSSVWAGGVLTLVGPSCQDWFIRILLTRTFAALISSFFSQRLLHNAIFYLCFQQLVELVQLKWLTCSILLCNKPARLNFLECVKGPRRHWYLLKKPYTPFMQFVALYSPSEDEMGWLAGCWLSTCYVCSFQHPLWPAIFLQAPSFCLF